MNSAVVVFSGGQDSTTCLGWTRNRFDRVEAITFFYGQRHAIELQAAERICKMFDVVQTIVDVSAFVQLVTSALVSNGNINETHPDHPNLPASFVPNRNALFLTLAHANAQRIHADAVVTGVCQTDFSGYPDCRQQFIDTLEMALKLGSETNVCILTPLMNINKAQTFALAQKEGVLEVVLEHSHTCYEGNRERRHAWGYGCGECNACKIRARGWDVFNAHL